jgi:DNA-binding PadR family transcriptional regulator
LLVLGLLARAPMHGYEIQKVLEMSRADRWAEVLPGSIYHALKKMAAEGLVTVQSTEQTGQRLRAIYAITEPGREEFRRLLTEMWSAPPNPYPTRLYSALTFLHELPPETVLPRVEALIATMEQEAAGWQVATARKGEAGVLPPHLQWAFENAREHLELDLRLLRRLREHLTAAPAAPTPPRGGPEGSSE